MNQPKRAMTITGTLIEAGTIVLEDGCVTGLLIEVSEDDLRDAEYLPLYQPVTITHKGP